MTLSPRPAALFVCGLAAIAGIARDATAHAGPPYPIVSHQNAGPYRVSVWTDPDTTDDGSPGGQFWVIVQRADGGRLPDGLPVDVSIRPLSRPGGPQSGRAQPVDGDASRQFVALVMNHEGPFAVRVALPAPGGDVHVEAEVEATYDLRPSPITAVVYLVPFLLVAGLWARLLLRRRRGRAAARRGEPVRPAPAGPAAGRTREPERSHRL